MTAHKTGHKIAHKNPRPALRGGRRRAGSGGLFLALRPPAPVGLRWCAAETADGAWLVAAAMAGVAGPA